LRAQRLGDPRAAVVAAMIFKGLADLLQQLPVLSGARAFLALQPRGIAAAPHAQESAQIGQRFFFGKLSNHLIARFYTSEMMPKVFFKISRWCRARASSLRSCSISRFISRGSSETGSSAPLGLRP